MAQLTVLDEGRPCVVDGMIAFDRLLLDAGALAAALDYVRRPEGLCQGDVCVPVRQGSGLEVDDLIDVTLLASMLDRPVALDAGAGAVYVGPAASRRAAQLQSLEAPDFTLPDLSGQPYSLSQFRGRKVLLAAYASW